MEEVLKALFEQDFKYACFKGRYGGYWALMIPESCSIDEFESTICSETANGWFIFSQVEWLPIAHGVDYADANSKLQERVSQLSGPHRDKNIHKVKMYLMDLEFKLDSHIVNAYVIPNDPLIANLIIAD